ncbi:hypothetical protein QD712_20330 [Streptomyces acidiscabies]|uniref:hypothetical protein n=1 Tax=Streptomyces acidiscabies TaxID=42234 RepID=UPI0030CBA5F0
MPRTTHDEPFDLPLPSPPPPPVPGCARCAELGRERAQAWRDRDLSKVTDCNVMIRTHDTGHQGNPGTG